MTEDDKAEEEAYLAEMDIPDEDTDEKLPEEDLDTSERVEVFDGYTADELKESLELIPKLQTALDTTNGTFGSRLAEQQALIETLQEREAQTGQLDPKVIERLGEEYPELAELLSPEKEVVPETSIDELVDARFQAFERDQDARDYNKGIQSLESIHSDWQETAMYSVNQDGTVEWKNQEFGKFVDTLPETDREVLFTAWNPEFVGRKITEFKQSIAKPKKDSTIANAARPKGVQSSASLSEDDEEAAAFAAEMKNY